MHDMDDRIKLSSIDRGFIGMPPLSILLFYERQLDPDHLYRSLLTTLDVLPVFSGKIVVDDGGVHWFQHVDRYFDFSVGEVEPPWDKLKEPLIALRDLEGVMSDPTTALGRPVMSIRLTRNTRGCVLSMGFSHCIADAESLKMFGYSLLMAANGLELPSFSRQRSFPFERLRDKPPTNDHGSLKHSDHPHRTVYLPRDNHVQALELSAEFVEGELSALRERGFECNAHDVIAAWLIKNHGKRLLSTRDRINVRIPINARPLCKHIEPTYLGNAFVDSFMSWSDEEVEVMDLGEIAATIRKVLVKSKDTEYLDARIFVDENGINYDRFGAEDKQGFDPESDIIITSIGELSHLLDLGAGPAVRSFNFPAVPLAFVVEKQSGRYLVSTIGAKPGDGKAA
jgi:Transferase family